MRTVCSIVAVASVALGLLGSTSGCGKKEDKLDVAAPPVTNAAPVPDAYPGKGRAPAPPTMGSGPRGK